MCVSSQGQKEPNTHLSEVHTSCRISDWRGMASCWQCFDSQGSEAGPRPGAQSHLIGRCEAGALPSPHPDVLPLRHRLENTAHRQGRDFKCKT